MEKDDIRAAPSLLVIEPGGIYSGVWHGCKSTGVRGFARNGQSATLSAEVPGGESQCESV